MEKRSEYKAVGNVPIPGLISCILPDITEAASRAILDRIATDGHAMKAMVSVNACDLLELCNEILRLMSAEDKS